MNANATLGSIYGFVLDAKTEFDCAFVHRKIECKVYPKDTVGVVSSSLIQIVRLS